MTPVHTPNGSVLTLPNGDVLERINGRWWKLVECAGITAAWCPIHGHCCCPAAPDLLHLNAPGCPLHDPKSQHGEHS